MVSADSGVGLSLLKEWIAVETLQDRRLDRFASRIETGSATSRLTYQLIPPLLLGRSGLDRRRDRGATAQCSGTSSPTPEFGLLCFH